MITGGIGSGKSVVSRILRLNGFKVYDCDSEARRIMEMDLGVMEQLIEILGEESYHSVGGVEENRRAINRPFIASKIFNDDELRNAVNRVVHKAVREDVVRFARECETIAFCETAIPATSKMEAMCESIWLVTASERERIERVVKRNGLSRTEVESRIATQKEEFSKLDEKKTHVIMNGKDNLILPCIFNLLSASSDSKLVIDKYINY